MIDFLKLIDYLIINSWTVSAAIRYWGRCEVYKFISGVIMSKTFDKYKNIRSKSSKKAGHDEIMISLRRLYFDYLEDVYNNRKLAYENPLEDLTQKLSIRKKSNLAGFTNKKPGQILEESILYMESGQKYDDGRRSFSYIENPDAKPITILIEK